MTGLLSKFGEQQLVMVNYAFSLNQWETGKCFDWILVRIIVKLVPALPPNLAVRYIISVKYSCVLTIRQSIMSFFYLFLFLQSLWWFMVPNKETKLPKCCSRNEKKKKTKTKQNSKKKKAVSLWSALKWFRSLFTTVKAQSMFKSFQTVSWHN